MKKIKIILLLVIATMSFCTTSFAVKPTEITKVEITGIDYPYSTGSVLDTNAEVSRDSLSLVSKVSWSTSENGLYVVTVTLRPNINCCYCENGVAATINGNVATDVIINEKEYLEVSYEFQEDSSQPNPNSANTLRHAIYTTYSSHGVIEPGDARVLHGKSITVKIIPNDGYKIKDVIVDGDSVGAVSEYTFRKVKESHKIKAYYDKIEVENDEDEETIITKEDGAIYLIIKNLINLILK